MPRYTPAFEKAVKKTLKNEGGSRMTNDPADRGGRTRYGISLRFLREIDAGATGIDIIEMTEERAKAIYYRHFWLACRCDRIRPPTSSALLFDMAVVMGQGNAVRCLQRALVLFKPNIAIDGVIGRETISALNKPDLRAEIVGAFKSACALYFRAIADRRPKQKRFLRGWIARVNKYCGFRDVYYPHAR